MTKNTKYFLYLLCGVLMFATFEVVSKSTGGYISASQLTFYRFLIGGVILLPFALRDLKVHHIRFSPKLILTFLVTGFLLVFISMNLCQVGLSHTSASLVAVLFSSNPLFVSLFSSMILKEKLTRGKIIGLICGVAGVIVTCGNFLFTPTKVDASFIFGIALVLFSMLVFSFYTVFNKKISAKMGSFPCLSFSSILGSLSLIPVLFLQNNGNTGNPFAFSLSSILPQFFYISICITGIAYYLYFDGVAHLDTSISSMSFFVKPPLASILSAIFLHEKITMNLIAGIILILGGVTISVRFGASQIDSKTDLA